MQKPSGDGEHGQRIEALCTEAAGVPAAARAAWLAARCGGDTALAAEVSRRLAASDVTSTVAHAAHAADHASQSADAMIGLQLGHWRIEQLIASGGMGSVYRARRSEGDFEQWVAIKLLHARGSEAIELSRRLAAERQILAQLDHPHIARLLDGGELPDGTPYLVMELVVGLRIDDWCEQQRPDPVARLRLFAKVCRAVQAAHRMLVVHRDLKPGNILVDIHGEPKLLDFGIAKVLGNAAGDETRADACRLTPRYAAPEQFAGHSGVGVDVYALGVILYELLTGNSPYGSAHLDTMTLIEAIRVQEPVPPSQLALPRGQARRLRGDLDAIVLKALRKDPRQRYAAVDELLDDVERHLDRRPVRARRGSSLYRFARFVERNRLPLALTASALLGLAATGMVWRTQRDAVVAERDKAERTTRFLASVLSGVSPSRAQGLDRTLMKQVLDDAAARLAVELGDAPEARASIAATLAETYVNLGETERALTLAEAEYRAVLEQQAEDARVSLRLAAETARARRDMASKMGDPNLLRRTFETQLQRFGASDADMLVSATHLVRQLRGAGEVEASREIGKVRVAAAVADADNAQALEALKDELAISHSMAGDHDAAIALHRDIIAAREQRSGPDSFDLMELRGNLGATLMLAKRYDEALATSTAVLPRYVATYGAEHPRTLVIRSNIAGELTMLGRASEALVICEELLAIRRRISGERHPETLVELGNLAATALRAGALDRAEKAFRAYIPLCDELRGTSHPGCAERRAGLGKVLRARGQFAEAEPWFLAAYAIKLRSEDRHFAGAEKIAAELALLYDAWRKPEQAALWRAKAAIPAE